MTKLYRYQRRGVQGIERTGGRTLLADAMGLGKSVQVLKWAEWYLAKGPIVVVCPASVKGHWQREATLHCNLRAEILGKATPPRNKLSKCPIYIINYDVLWKGKKVLHRRSWVNKLLELDPQLIILDECHYLQSRTTKRTRAVRALCKEVPHIVALGGTPLTNRPAELFPTLNILWPDEFPSFVTYGYRYCGPEKKPWGMEYKGATHLDELHDRLKKLGMIRRLKQDVLKDLPAKTQHIIPVELADRREYDAAEKDFLTWLRKLSPARARRAAKAEYLVRRGYLHRLAGEAKLAHDIEWVENFLQESDGKLILFGVHKKVLKPLYQKFHADAVLVDGSVTGKKRQLAIDDFTHNKRKRLFVGNIKAAGVGWPGQVASDVAFVEMYWSPGLHTQAEDRAHRIGQKYPVTVHYLVAENTIEEDLCSILQSKQEVVSKVLDGTSNDSLEIMKLLDDALLKRRGVSR